MYTRTALTILAGLCVALISTESWAQGGTYGGGVIAPGSPPIVLSGTSGGPRQARSFGSSCRGTIAVRPDHIINVVSPMQVRFEVLNASGDTTMVVVGPSGVFCDDDSGNGFNPRIIQHLVPGQYQIYVGTYSGGNLYPYTIQFTGMGAPAPAPMPVVGAAIFGTAVLGYGNMMASFSGTSGGPMPANSYGSSCRGYINQMPSHIITVTAPMVATFDVTGSGDTTLVITGPGGTHCNDDGGNGFNPRITRPLTPGTYQIFVGSYSQGSVHPYTLSIHP